MDQELNFRNFGAKPDLVLQGDRALSDIGQMIPTCEKLSASIARLSRGFRCEIEARILGHSLRAQSESDSPRTALAEAAAEMKNRLMLGRNLSAVLMSHSRGMGPRFV